MKVKSKQFLQGIDSMFLISFGILVLLGLVILQTASSVTSFLEYGHPYHYFLNQLVEGVAPGLVLFLILSKIPYIFWRKVSFIGFIGVFLLNCLVLFPSFATSVNGATRWINLFGIGFQPAELLKLALLLYIAMLLAKFKESINKLNIIVFILAIIGISVGFVVIIQSNLSTGIILMVLSGGMLFQSTLKSRYLIMLGLGAVLIAFIFILIEPYRLQRLMTFSQGQEQDLLGTGYQIEQNLIAVGSGGVSGVGWNQSRQKFLYLPEARTDSIFAVYGEEAGFIGVTILVGIFAFLSFRIIWLSTQVKDDFGRYILIGGVTWFMAQAFLNIGATIKLVPLTGIPLPFISVGSSSIWVLCALFGIMANVSTYRRVKTE